MVTTKKLMKTRIKWFLLMNNKKTNWRRMMFWTIEATLLTKWSSSIEMAKVRLINLNSIKYKFYNKQATQSFKTNQIMRLLKLCRELRRIQFIFKLRNKMMTMKERVSWLKSKMKRMKTIISKWKTQTQWSWLLNKQLIMK